MPLDPGFLLGFAFGCICTAAMLLWKRLIPAKYRWAGQWQEAQHAASPAWTRSIPAPWQGSPHPLTRELGAAARGEVADLAVSAGQFVSSVRSMKRQIDRAHQLLRSDLQ